MNIRIVLLSLSVFVSAPAVAQIQHVGSRDYLPYAGVDFDEFEGRDRHITILSDPSDPTTLRVVSARPDTGKPYVSSPFICGKNSPVAYYSILTPSTIHRGQMYWGAQYQAVTVIVPRDKRAPAVRLSFGCRALPPR